MKTARSNTAHGKRLVVQERRWGATSRLVRSLLPTLLALSLAAGLLASSSPPSVGAATARGGTATSAMKVATPPAQRFGGSPAPAGSAKPQDGGDGSWDDGFGATAPGATVNALAVDNGTLYALVGGKQVLTWDGSRWAAIGGSVGGEEGASADALAVGGGNVYIGGGFSKVGVTTVSNVAQWYGGNWHGLGDWYGDHGHLITHYATGALGVLGDKLYVGAEFHEEEGSFSSCLASWQGSWADVGLDCDSYSYVYTLLASGAEMYAAGDFSDGILARGHGYDWTTLAQGDGRVTALAIDGGDLYAGGNFTQIGGINARQIAKWDGSQWSSLGGGLSGSINALAVFAGELYSGGSFDNVAPGRLSYIVKWDGKGWADVGGDMNGAVLALATDGAALYAGGAFTESSDVAASYLAKWDGHAWSALGEGSGAGVAGNVYALAVGDNAVYAGGSFTRAGAARANNIARWDGSNWAALGDGVGGTVAALAVSGGDIFAGGVFTQTGTVSANYVARWDGNHWHALGAGLDGPVNALVVSGGQLYAGGDFTEAGGQPANYVARWDGDQWHALGGGVSGGYLTTAVYALVTSGGSVYVGGKFSYAGAVRCDNIARWDGDAWHALGPGVGDGYYDASVDAIAVSGGDVYAAGYFWDAGHAHSKNIARWDGSQWTQLGYGVGASSHYPYFDTAHALAVSAGEIYAGGAFQGNDAVGFAGLGRWDGDAWSEVGGGVDGAVYALAADGDDLYVAGDFSRAGTKDSDHFAIWHAAPPAATRTPTATASPSSGPSATPTSTPGDTYVANGDFEQGWFFPWRHSALTWLNAEGHSGCCGALLTAWADPYEPADMDTMVTLPDNAATLSFWYSTASYDPEAGSRKYSISAPDGSYIWGPLPASGWRQVVVDVSAYQGQTVGLEFSASGMFSGEFGVSMWIDDVQVTTYTPIPFVDVHEADYFYTAVQYLSARGAISGYSGSPPCPAAAAPCFLPFASATRAQALKITLLASGIPLINPSSASFSDVPVGSPFFSVVETAVAKHIVGGYADGSFRPNNPITRGQLSKVVALARGWSLLDPARATFGDVPRGSPFYSYVETAAQLNIIGGYDCGAGCREFRPANNATRGQIARMVYNAVSARQR